MLKMKSACEKCNQSILASESARICSYECTYCESCAQAMSYICPNCSGELVARPRRTKSPLNVIASQIKSKLSKRGDSQ